VPKVTRASSHRQLDGVNRRHRTIDCAADLPQRKWSYGATRASLYFCLAFGWRGDRRPRTLAGRNGEPFNRADLALITAVARRSPRVENGTPDRQLHMKGRGKLGRMREFKRQHTQSLDDGMIVFDEDESIVRNNALGNLQGIECRSHRAPPREVFDERSWVRSSGTEGETRAARQIFKVTITARHATDSDSRAG